MSNPEFTGTKYHSRRGPNATMPDHATISEDIAQSKTVEFIEYMHKHGCVAFVTVLAEEKRQNKSEKEGFGIMSVAYQFGACNIEDSVEASMMIGQTLATLTNKMQRGDPTLSTMVNDVHVVLNSALETLQYPTVGPRGTPNPLDELITFLIDEDGKIKKV